MSFSCQQHSTTSWKLKAYFLFLFFGMKKSNANMALFMNMVKEKRSSEIPLLSKNISFWLHIGPRTFAFVHIPWASLVPVCRTRGRAGSPCPSVFTGLGTQLVNWSGMYWRPALCLALWNTRCYGQNRGTKRRLSSRDLLTHRTDESEAYKNRDPFIRYGELSIKLCRIQI